MTLLCPHCETVGEPDPRGHCTTCHKLVLMEGAIRIRVTKRTGEAVDEPEQVKLPEVEMIYTVEELRMLFGLKSQQAILQHIRQGDIPAKKKGRSWRCHQHDLERRYPEFLKGQKPRVWRHDDPREEELGIGQDLPPLGPRRPSIAQSGQSIPKFIADDVCIIATDTLQWVGKQGDYSTGPWRLNWAQLDPSGCRESSASYPDKVARDDMFNKIKEALTDVHRG